ncbi:MAG TPA: ABC transporter permease [Vicinamibacterales bacterium]|nr:ABC transporter permease [Vicinamibacterales bacterium]
MKRSLRSWLWRVPIEQEVDEELALHLELRTRELIAAGVDPREARDIALRRMGDVRTLRRACVTTGRKRNREMKLSQWIDERRHDISFAIRQLRSAPGFTLVATMTLALGIGANSAIFALADAALLRPLPFPGSDRLVMLWERRADGTRNAVNPVEFVEWSERTRTFDALAAVLAGGGTIENPDGTAEAIDGQAVSARFFDVLGVRPIAGRTFQAGDEAPQGQVVVLGEGFWRERFGADPTVVGRVLTLDGRSMTVIGIVPAQMETRALGGTRRVAIWTLLNTPSNRVPAQRYAHYMRVIGRLEQGTTLDAAASDMNTIADGIARESPATNRGHGVAIEPLRDALIGRELRLTALLLLGVVTFVLLLCCANVANLFLSRTTARARELAVRSALGAGRARIVAQLLTESMVLAALGGAAGVAVGAAILRIAPSMIPPGLLPPTMVLGFNGRVVAFCTSAAVAIALMVGLAPACRATSRSLLQQLGGRGTTAHSTRFRSVLVGAEIAVAVLLLCGAGLLLRTLVMLDRVDPGHRAGDALTAIINLPMTSSPDAMRRFYAAVEREIGAVPGVRGVAWGSGVPLDGWWFGQTFQIVGDPPRAPTDRDPATYQMVSASHFSTLGIPVLRGRAFAAADTAEAAPVAIVNEEFVRRHAGGRDPLRMRISVNAMTQPPSVVEREIVGVVGHVMGLPDRLEPEPQIYVPIQQNAWWSATLVVRPASGAAAALAPAVRAAVARVDKTRALTRIQTLDEIERGATSRWRFRAQLVGTFAALALAVAVIGVFGVLAYSVQQRVPEVAVRMALGARRGDVLTLVLSSTARVVIVGSLIGLALAALASRWIATLLFGVTPLDPITFAAAAIVLAVAAAVAATVPALRAMRVSPVIAFRQD